MRIGAAYIRVSTDDQTELSPASQIKQIQDYAKQNNIVVPEQFIFADEGISGKNTKKRTEFNRMIGIAKTKPKPFDCILLWKYSRFARNREDSIVYKSMLRKQLGIDVISITETLGDDKMSILIEALIEAMDEYYSINLAEEVKRGMTERASRGEAVSVPAYGYNIESGKYIVNEQEALIVKQIFNDFCNGKGQVEIAKKLNALGIKTKRGKLWENRTINYVLNNPVYIGKIRWNPNGITSTNYDDENIMIIDGIHESIVSTKIWDESREKLNILKRMKKPREKNKPDPNYMLYGLVRCGNCGGSLTRAGYNGLQCHKYSHGKCGTSHFIGIKRIDKMTIDLIETTLRNGTFTLTPKRNFGDHQKINIINKQIQQEHLKLNRVKEAYECGVDTIEEYKVNKTKILLKIQELEQSKPPQDNKINKKQFAKKYLPTVETLKRPDINETDKNKILKQFVDTIVYHRATDEIEIHYFY